MKKIMIKEYTGSDIAVSYDDGKRCQKDIAECLDKGGFNFRKRKWCDEIFGIKNTNETAIQKIKCVRDGALIKREDLEE